jgi:hypothetical protein
MDNRLIFLYFCKFAISWGMTKTDKASAAIDVAVV